MKKTALCTLLLISACSQNGEINDGQIQVSGFIEVPVTALGTHTKENREINALVALNEGHVAAWSVTNAVVTYHPAVTVVEPAKAKMHFFDGNRNELASKDITAGGAFISGLIPDQGKGHVFLSLDGELEPSGNFSYRAEKFSLNFQALGNGVDLNRSAHNFRTRTPQLPADWMNSGDDAVKQFQSRTKRAIPFDAFAWSADSLNFSVDPLLSGNAVKFTFGNGVGDTLLVKPLSQQYAYPRQCFNTDGKLVDALIASKTAAEKSTRDHEILTRAAEQVTGFVPYYQGKWNESDSDHMSHCVVSEPNSGLGQTAFMFGKRSLNRSTRTSYLIVTRTQLNPLASETKLFQMTQNISVERPLFIKSLGKFLLFGALGYDQAVTNSVGNTKGFVAIFNPKSLMVEKVWMLKGARSTHVKTVLHLPETKKIWVGGYTNSGDTHDPVEGSQPFVEAISLE